MSLTKNVKKGLESERRGPNPPEKPPIHREGLQSFQVGQASQTAVEPQKPQRGPGRPPEFDQDICDEILERISDGETLMAICEGDPDRMPNRATFRKWCRERPELFAAHARARIQQAESWSDAMIETADDGTRDTKTIETANGSYDTIDREWVERSKLKIETRKWLMARLHAKQWGDKLEQTITGNMTTKFTLSVGDGSVQQRQEKPADELSPPRMVFDLPAKSAQEIIEENL